MFSKGQLKWNIRMIVRNSEGKIIIDYKGHNKIVNLGYENIITFLYNGSGEYITNIALGTGGIDEFGEALPIDVEEESLHEEIIATNEAVDESEIVEEGKSLRISKIYLSSEVDEEISEMGMYLGNGSLFAKHNFKAIDLTIGEGEYDSSLQIIWTITP